MLWCSSLSVAGMNHYSSEVVRGYTVDDKGGGLNLMSPCLLNKWNLIWIQVKLKKKKINAVKSFVLKSNNVVSSTLNGIPIWMKYDPWELHCKQNEDNFNNVITTKSSLSCNGSYRMSKWKLICLLRTMQCAFAKLITRKHTLGLYMVKNFTLVLFSMSPVSHVEWLLTFTRAKYSTLGLAEQHDDHH